MAKQERVTRFSVSLPNSLLVELDRRVIRRGYASRSEFVRDLIRERMVEDRWEAGSENVVGVLTIGFAFCFMVVKYFEYSAKIHHGLLPETPRGQKPLQGQNRGTLQGTLRV